MLKRFANIFLILVVLLLTVQPRLVLHFCGDTFIALYINHDPSLIKSGCNKSDHCANQDHCATNNLTQSADCVNRNIITIDIDAEDFTIAGSYTLPAPADDVVLLLPKIEELCFAEPTAYLFYGKSPPKNLSLSSGRDILTRNCVYLI